METEGEPLGTEAPPWPTIDSQTGGLARALFDTMHLRMGVLELREDSEVCFVWINEAQATFMGSTVHEAQGRPFSAFSSLEVGALWRAKCLQAQAAQGSVSFDFAGSARHPGHHSASVTFLPDPSAGRPRFGFVALDTTVRQRSQERLSAIVESAPGYIFTSDRDLTVLTFSGPAETGKLLIGKSMLIWIPPAHREHVRGVLEHVLRTGELGHYETPAYNADGQARYWFASDVGPLRRDGEIIGLTVLSSEITARKRLEQQVTEAFERARADAEELSRKNELLEREIEERRRTEARLRAQQEQIRALSTPLIEIWDGVLALPVIGAVDAERAMLIMEKLLAEIARARVQIAILDLTGATGVDATTAGHLFRIASATRLLGSRCVLSGISPRIAQTMATLGEEAQSFTTFGTLNDALRYALARLVAR